MQTYKPFAGESQDKIWLNDLKVGDEVIISAGYGGDELATVSRITATQILLAAPGRRDYARFRRKDGYRVGEQLYGRSKLFPVTEARRLSVQRRQLHGMLAGIQLKDLEQLTGYQCAKLQTLLRALLPAKVRT